MFVCCFFVFLFCFLMVAVCSFFLIIVGVVSCVPCYCVCFLSLVVDDVV